MAGAILPSLPGGVHSTIWGHPATRAGTASISTVEKSGADPPGMYSPTRRIGTARCRQRTPGVVSTSTGRHRWAAWNVSMFRAAAATACFSSSDTASAASAISSGETSSEASSTPSISFVSLRSASSPSVRTASRMAFTLGPITDRSIWGLCSSRSHCRGSGFTIVSIIGSFFRVTAPVCLRHRWP